MSFINNSCCHNQIDCSEREFIIKQLKEQLHEYESKDRDFNELQCRYRHLKNDFNLINEEKLRIEFDLRQRTEELNKHILEFRADIENIQYGMKDKNLLNMKLFNEKTTLEKSLESKDSEINMLKLQISKIESEFAMYREHSHTMEKNFKLASDAKEIERLNADKYYYEIEKFSKICSEQDMLIRNLNEEKIYLSKKIDELNYELKNVANKYRNRDENFNYIQNQLEESKNRINSLENYKLALEEKLSKYQIDNNKLASELNSANISKTEMERNLSDSQKLLNEKNLEIRKLLQEMNEIKQNIDRIGYDRSRYSTELERLKLHIITLTEQNHKLSSELESMIERDDKLFYELDRKERIKSILNKSGNDHYEEGQNFSYSPFKNFNS